MSEGRLTFPTLAGAALFVLFLLIYPAQARADGYVSFLSENTVLAMTGMTDEEMAALKQIPAGRPGDPDYKPPEESADDSSMALIVALVFGMPVGTWAVMRELKRAKRPQSPQSG